jgi:hypothetical protein
MACQFTVRAADEMRQWEWDDWSVLVALAALDTDPETLTELQAAMRRYQPERKLVDTGRSLTGIAQAAGPTAWCLVDLVGRSVVAGGGFRLPDRSAAYEPDDARREQIDGFPLVWLNTPDDWRFFTANRKWQERVAKRAKRAQQTQPLDARSILFGRPLLEFMADRVLAEPDEGSPAEAWLKPARRIHADWLMTQREDLGHRTPRELLVEDLERIQSELERRAQQWTMQAEAPPPLLLESRGYRFGRFGATEAVLYFDMIRKMLQHAFALRKQAMSRAESPLARDELVARLEEFRDEWLATPNSEIGSELTPMEMIESERRRVPLVEPEGYTDCDCPICMAEKSESGGPMFFWMDDCHLEMEDEFAFSLIPSRAEWEERQEAFRQSAREWERKDAERPAATRPPDESPGIWQSCYVNWDELSDPNLPPSVVKMSIGFLLAEFVNDLRSRGADRDGIRQLNEAYVDFRTSEDPLISRAAAQVLRDRIEYAGQVHADLLPKSADLQSRLDEVLRRVEIARPD